MTQDEYTEQSAKRLGITVAQYLYHYKLECKCRVDGSDNWTYDPDCFMGKPPIPDQPEPGL